MSPLTVLTWFWQQKRGRAKFTATHVNIWAAMVRRHLTIPHRICCVTDTPDGIDHSIRIISPPRDFEDVRLNAWPEERGRPQCLRRLAMFAPGAGRRFGRRFVCMDLDVVIGANIDHILGRKDDFVICGPSRSGAKWMYNGSMMLMTAGARRQVYERFNPIEAEQASANHIGSDQAWIAHVLGPGQATFSAADGVVRWGEAETGSMMFFPGHIKPWNAIGDPWVGEHYRLDGGRSGLILGGRSSLWNDVREALRERIYDIVIAVPQAADRWPDRVDEIAESLPHAHCLARMLGIEQPVVCGG